MSSTTLSQTRSLVDSDVNAGRSQLGLSWTGPLGVPTTLWSLLRGGNRYLVTPSANVTITLPVVGIASTEAQPGYSILLGNNSSTFTITVNNSAAVLVASLAPGRSAILTSNNTIAPFWSVSLVSPTTLQEAYNSSGVANPKIALTDAFGTLRINDSPTAAAEVFAVNNDGGASSYFRVGNAASPADSPFIGAFGGAATATNCVVIGPTSSSVANSVILTDSSAVPINALANSFNTTFSGGETAYGGIVREGTTLTSPNKRFSWFSADAVTIAPFVISTGITLNGNSTYSVEAEIYGRDSASEVSASIKLRALITTLAGTPTIAGSVVSEVIETPGFTVVPASATFTFSGLLLQITMTAPDNIAGNMVVRGELTYRVLTA
jgi:hypothetical protein